MMATSCVLFDPAACSGVRVNWDGYPERMLPLLNEHWSFAKKGDEWSVLFARGEIRSLDAETCTTEWYGNSQSFSCCSPRTLLRDVGADYLYLYIHDSDRWVLWLKNDGSAS